MTQKLSINLKRLNNTYTSCTTQDDTTSSSDEHSDLVPDFPPPNPPLMLRINAQTLSSAPGAEGNFVCYWLHQRTTIIVPQEFGCWWVMWSGVKFTVFRGGLGKF